MPVQPKPTPWKWVTQLLQKMQFSPCIRGHLTERQEQKLQQSPGLGLRMFTPASPPIPSRGLSVAFEDLSATDDCSVARYILDRLKDHPEAFEFMICEEVALGRHSEHRNTFDRDAWVEIPAQAVDGAAQRWIRAQSL